MANLFNITTATSTVTLDGQRTGKASFTVSNTSANTVHARARVSSADASTLPWFTIEGQSGRVMAPAGTEQYTVDIAVPPNVPPKDYTFSLLVVDESNPDENYTEGPGVRISGLESVPKPVPKPFPWWIVAVAVVAILIVIIAIVVIVTQNNQSKANATATQNAVNTATTAANATSSNIATQTAAAAQTLTALANAHATQTAFAFTQTALAPTVTRTPTATSTPRPPQSINVFNGAGVVAQFSVTYTFQGSRQTQSIGDFDLGQGRTITIPGDSVTVDVQITASGKGTVCTFSYGVATTVSISLSGTIFGVNCSGG